MNFPYDPPAIATTQGYWGGTGLAGIFEIAQAGDKAYFFRLTAADGTVVAVSPLFSSIKSAAAGINAVRENAATGLVVDHSGAHRRVASSRSGGRAMAPLAGSPVAAG
ncbi:YegP family protein [Microbacterium sp. Bi128]|uniref:YegP family protein n=1 Tax=Microbacterium sp. Bi128 TaxID=2821115 RepID=UPI0027E2386C|nr:YegP family protein [Microbacterium sp. Bi128]